MQFLILSLVALVAAAPSLKLRSPLAVCPALDTPQCCQLDVDGVVDSTCETPDDTSSVWAFQKSCAKTGYTAECCTLPVAGDALLCTAP